jgi:hypothetical protein
LIIRGFIDIFIFEGIGVGHVHTIALAFGLDSFFEHFIIVNV